MFFPSVRRASALAMVAMATILLATTVRPGPAMATPGCLKGEHVFGEQALEDFFEARGSLHDLLMKREVLQDNPGLDVRNWKIFLYPVLDRGAYLLFVQDSRKCVWLFDTTGIDMVDRAILKPRRQKLGG